VSLHVVLRALCEQGYDRQLLAQIRTVLASGTPSSSEQVWGGARAFEQQARSILEQRHGKRYSSLEVKALTHMAAGWLETASHMHLTEERRGSLVRCFDEVVATCASTTRDLVKSMGPRWR
jgi:hypothetical protein